MAGRTRTKTKRATTAVDLVEALADVIAHRVAAKIIEAQKPPPAPIEVPMWLMGPKPPGPARTGRPPASTTSPTPNVSETWTEADVQAFADRAIREAGEIRMGEAGYQPLLEKYLAEKRVRDAELHVRAQTRKAARLLAKLVERAASQRE